MLFKIQQISQKILGIIKNKILKIGSQIMLSEIKLKETVQLSKTYFTSRFLTFWQKFLEEKKYSLKLKFDNKITC